MNRVLITGITGFLGSEIAKELISKGIQVIGVKRQASDLKRIKAWGQTIEWIDADSDLFYDSLQSANPNFIIHSAWTGVGANERDNLNIQFSNHDLLLKLLASTETLAIRKIICFGSQAEYGQFSEVISEDRPSRPTTAYGLAKQHQSEILEHFCTTKNINWIWLRLFSFFGETEDPNWFIPTLVRNILSKKPMDMTPGEQSYAYMYVKDLAKVVVDVIEKDVFSGCYNVSSKKAISLKNIVKKIEGILGVKNSTVNFGALPYRANQSMLIQGDVSKLEGQIGEILESDFDKNLEAVIENIRSIK